MSTSLTAAVEQGTISLRGVRLQPADDLAPAIAQSRRGADLLSVELTPGYDDEALGRLLAAARNTGLAKLELRSERRVLAIALESAAEARLVVWTRMGQLRVFDVDAADATLGTLGPIQIGDSAGEELLRAQLELACRNKVCRAGLELTAGKDRDLWRALDAWERITAPLPGVTSALTTVREPVKLGATTVSGFLPPTLIQRVVRKNFGRFRACYEPALARDANLTGRVSARFVIGRDGKVSSVSDGNSDLPDQAVVGCVLKAFESLQFPPPVDGIVTVVYPVLFAPG